MRNHESTYSKFQIPKNSLSKSLIERLPKINHKSLDSSSPESKHKYLNLLSDLEKLCDSYEQLPIIEFEQDEVLNPTTNLSETQNFKPQEDNKLKFIINQLKIRIKNYPNMQAAYPSSNRFKVVSETEEKVGPGTYKSIILNKLEAYEFSNIPRLHTPIAHTMHTIESLYKKRNEITENSIIRKNKLLAINPLHIKEDFVNKIHQFKLKEKDAKIKKQFLEEKNKIEKKTKLNEKLRKFEWRMTKEEVAIVQKTWGLLITCIGMRTVVSDRVKVRRILRVRWGKILRKFFVACECLGKFLLLLSKIRKKYVGLKINSFAKPMIEYIRVDLINKKKVINWIVEKTRDMPFIIHIMAKWKYSISLIQKNIRSIKKINKARRVALGLLWDKIISAVQKARTQDKIHRSLTGERMFVMPSFIKEKFIRKYIRFVIIAYNKEKKLYFQKIQKIRAEQNSEKIHKNLEKLVKKPVLTLFGSKDKLSSYIEKATAYKAKIEKKQRDAKYNMIVSHDLNRTLTKNIK